MLRIKRNLCYLCTSGSFLVSMTLPFSSSTCPESIQVTVRVCVLPDDVGYVLGCDCHATTTMQQICMSEIKHSWPAEAAYPVCHHGLRELVDELQVVRKLPRSGEAAILCQACTKNREYMRMYGRHWKDALRSRRDTGTHSTGGIAAAGSTLPMLGCLEPPFVGGPSVTPMDMVLGNEL
jgi:hypothetical protein